ncbi:MAG TPA: hypothetical protein VII31_14300 [Caldimonas sp.]
MTEAAGEKHALPVPPTAGPRATFARRLDPRIEDFDLAKPLLK